MLTRKRHIFIAAATLGATLLAPLAMADTIRSDSRTPAQEQIAERLDQFEYAAGNLRSGLDGYASSMRSLSPHIQSHAYQLNHAKEQVNSLGDRLAELERLSPQGTDLQQLAVRKAKSHLEAVAGHVQTAIAMLNEDQHSSRFPAYRETLKGMYTHADSLYTKVDAIINYEKSRDRAVDAAARAESDDV
jgi:DNA repair ATPase RecN